MVQNTFTTTVVPIIILFIFILFMWYKLREPLSGFWLWLTEMMSSGKEKTIQTIHNPREIVYDI